MAEKQIDVDKLVAALDARRRAEGMSWRKLALDAGVSPSTLTRMQQGKSPDVNTFTALTKWLNIPAERFGLEAAHDRGSQPAEAHPMSVVSTLLRGKHKMSPRAMNALEELVNAAYRFSKITKDLK